MFSLELLRELYRHMDWGDAAVWSAVPADDDLARRLHHIQMTQRFWLKLWREESIDVEELRAFTTPEGVLAGARQYYREVHPFLERVTEPELQRKLDVPWAAQFARDGVVVAVTVAEAMFQVTAHSNYHRGQINSRLRAIGIDPPNVDYIAWVWGGRPAPAWPASAASAAS